MTPQKNPGLPLSCYGRPLQTKESRPALNRLMADAHHRKFDAVLVWKIDRFGRSLKHLVNSLADLAVVGVAFRIESTGFGFVRFLAAMGTKIIH